VACGAIDVGVMKSDAEADVGVELVDTLDGENKDEESITNGFA
jgi:hypothetical protein